MPSKKKINAPVLPESLATAQTIIAFLRPFRQYFNLRFFKKYGLKHCAHLGFTEVELDAVIIGLTEKGLWSRRTPSSNFWRIQPLFGSIKRTEDAAMRQKMEKAFLIFYDNYANGLDIGLKSSETDQRKAAQDWIVFETENLWQTLRLSLQHRFICHGVYALGNFLRQDRQLEFFRRFCEEGLLGLEQFTIEQQNLRFYTFKLFLLNGLGELEEESKNYDAAIVYYHQIVSVLTNLNTRYAYQQNEDDQLFEGQTDLGAVWLNLGNCYAQKQQFQQAEAFYLKAAQQFETYKDNDRLASTFNMLGTLNYQSGKSTQAESYFQKALQNCPKDTPQYARILLNAGQNTMNRGDFELSEKQLTTAGTLFESWKALWHTAQAELALGNLFMEKADYNTAIRHYKTALPLFMTEGDAVSEALCLQNLGLLSAYETLFDDSEEYLSKAYALLNQEGTQLQATDVAHNLGSLYMNQNRLELAEKWLLTALEKHLYTAGGLNDKGELLFKLGILYDLLEQPQKVISYMTEALAIFKNETENPNSADAEHYLAEARQKLVAS